jgi:membrane-bound inhibitor of C-type lysozyme
MTRSRTLFRSIAVTVFAIAGAGIGALATSTPASAQIFVSYQCDDGTPVGAAFFNKERRMHIQVDGKGLSLPQRLSGSGARYAKSGLSFWIKSQQATLKRPKRKAVMCKAV